MEKKKDECKKLDIDIENTKKKLNEKISKLDSLNAEIKSIEYQKDAKKCKKIFRSKECKEFDAKIKEKKNEIQELAR